MAMMFEIIVPDNAMRVGWRSRDRVWVRCAGWNKGELVKEGGDVVRGPGECGNCLPFENRVAAKFERLGTAAPATIN